MKTPLVIDPNEIIIENHVGEILAPIKSAYLAAGQKIPLELTQIVREKVLSIYSGLANRTTLA